MKKILFHYGDANHTPERKRLNAYGPIGYYRIVKPSEQVRNHEVKVAGNTLNHYGDTMETQWENIFTQHDVFWTGYFSDKHVASAMYYFRDKLKKKVIIDIDDNYLDIPESNDLYERFKPGTIDRAMLSTVLSFADAITVSTYPLKERIQAHIRLVHGIDKPIYVIPNMNEAKDWKFKRATPRKDKITIGYWASNSHQDDLMMIMPALKKLMKKHKNLYFQSIGTIAKEKIPLYFKGFSGEMLTRIELGAAESVFKRAPKRLSEMQWDIGIAPLVDTAFTRCKSHIKWLEMSMYKIPIVASRVYPYFMSIQGVPTIVDNETGLIARSNEWEQKLEMLITDADLRKRIGENAYNFVKERWQYSQGSIGETINTMLKAIS